MKYRMRTFIEWSGGFAVLAVILFYGYLEVRDVLQGPLLALTSPLNGQTVREQSVAIAGIAERISAITINDRPITVDESGVFSEIVLLAPGYNVIKIEATDRLGRVVRKTIELVHQAIAHQ